MKTWTKFLETKPDWYLIQKQQQQFQQPMHGTPVPPKEHDVKLLNQTARALQTFQAQQLTQQVIQTLTQQ